MIYQKPRAALIVHGNTSYDPDLYVLRVNDRPVVLTVNEVQLLSLLLDRYARIVRRDLLLDLIYGHRPTPPSYKAIRVSVCRLRRKLRHAGATLVIRTVRGQGIILECAT